MTKECRASVIVLVTAVVAMVAASVASGCAGSRRNASRSGSLVRHTHELLQSVLWTQSAAEYRGSALQSYALARRMLDRALSDPAWSAGLEETASYSDLPPAVILDVDETVLDNSAYQARLIVQNAAYDNDTWNAWCREMNALPVPGALGFTRYAADKGVAVFYVTNRRHEVEEATRKNLEKYGFPLDRNRDTLYTRGEKEGWQGSDKTPRRQEIASRFRLLLLVGDNLGDFLPGTRGSVKERMLLAEKYADYWGSRWILLPNPQYGGWEGAIFDFDYGLSDGQRLKRKYEALRTR
ncbi:MAG: 5'-nucleotidase, lipoprotein e(P4) family [Acidobacteriota bacterium]